MPARESFVEAGIQEFVLVLVIILGITLYMPDSDGALFSNGVGGGLWWDSRILPNAAE